MKKHKIKLKRNKNNKYTLSIDNNIINYENIDIFKKSILDNFKIKITIDPKEIVYEDDLNYSNLIEYFKTLNKLK